MKKFILATCLMALFLGTRAQDTLVANGKQYVPLDTSGLTAKQVYEDAKAGIKGLATALKQPAEHVYIVLVRQQIIVSICWVLGVILVAIFAFFVSKCVRQIYDASKTVSDSFGHWAGIVILHIAVFTGVIACVCHAKDAVTGFVNPEYGAIKDIFEFVRGK